MLTLKIRYISRKKGFQWILVLGLLLTMLVFYLQPESLFGFKYYGVINDTSLSEYVLNVRCRQDRHESGQNVIAYSLYGNFSDPELSTRYLQPLKLNIDRIQHVYPGWIIRIYSTFDGKEEANNKRLQELFGFYPQVDLCNATEAFESLNLDIDKLFPMVWRFLPLLDPTVDNFMSRDSDSIILDREVEAVRDWFNKSTATFHIMKDNPSHCTTDILGGLWGAKIHQNRNAIRKAAANLLRRKLSPRRLVKQIDQILLTQHIWPLASKDMVAHDSYCCYYYPEFSRPFLSRRINFDFVGNVHSFFNMNGSRIDACPANCRPPMHPEWLHC